MTLKDLVKHNGNGNSTGNGNGNGNSQTSNLSVRHEETSPSSLPAVYNEMTQWMDEWSRRFDSLFGRAFGLTPFRSMMPQWSNRGDWSDWGSQWNSFVPAVNISESDNEYRVTAELPGMDENDVEVSLSRGSLLIRGEKKAENEDRGQGYYRMERSYGTFQRAIPLPQEVDAEKVDATFKKGLLTITLPKLPAEQTGARRISIKTEQPQK